MRGTVLLLSFIFIAPLAAQERGRVHRFPPDWNNALPNYEKRVQLLTASIKRDAFIISRVTLAMGDLADDFQKLSAIQKAYDRIEEASIRAGQDPKASPRTQTALGKMRDALEAGRRQGTMANLADLRTEVSRQSAGIQREVFQELADARGERLNLIDLLNRVQTMNSDLEGAMVEALGTTFDYMAAGGR